MVQYHSALDLLGTSAWAQAIGATLANCPLVPALVTLGVLLCLLGWGIVYRLHALQRRRRHLAARLASMRAAPVALSGREPPAGMVDVPLPRSLRRYLLSLCVVGAVQITTYIALDMIAPMHGVMVMPGGVIMDVPATLPLALGPLHLVVAVLLSTFLWAVDRRVVRLRHVVEALQKTIASYALALDGAPWPLPAQTVGVPRRSLLGYALFSRPPPA
jgi:hypothetical protein